MTTGLPAWFAGTFDAVPAAHRACLFGLDYAVLDLPEGDELFLTHYGWPWRHHLLPERWYRDGSYHKQGTRLRRSTGTVYRVASTAHGRELRLIAKIARFAQHLDASELLPGGGAFPAYLSPFEEFGAVLRLRRSRRGPPILTKRPLAILCPSTTYRRWELGRNDGWVAWHAARLAAEQGGREGARRVTLHADRDYLTVFRWIDGLTLLDLRAMGLLDDRRIEEIMLTVIGEMDQHRMRVLDHKPDHVIVRPRPDGTLPVRRGRLTYALADYELLVDT